MLVAWILNTIEPTLRLTVTYTETVKELWDDIRQRFSIGNGARIHQLKTDLAACKQHGQPAIFRPIKDDVGRVVALRTDSALHVRWMQVQNNKHSG